MHNSTFFRSHEARQQIIVLAGTASPSNLQFCERDLFVPSIKFQHRILKRNHISVNYITVLGHFRSYNNQSTRKSKTMQILSEKEENLHTTSLGEENCFILCCLLVWIGLERMRKSKVDSQRDKSTETMTETDVQMQSWTWANRHCTAACNRSDCCQTEEPIVAKTN